MTFRIDTERSLRAERDQYRRLVAALIERFATEGQSVTFSADKLDAIMSDPNPPALLVVRDDVYRSTTIKVVR